MLSAVFICDKEWMIKAFMNCSPELQLHIGDRLTDMVIESEQLQSDSGSKRALLLTFPNLSLSIPAKIQIFPEGILVVLYYQEDGVDLVRASELYEKGLGWAEDRFRDLFHDEYYMIQQLNNQLIDSKRSLARTNSKLRVALGEVEQANEELDKAKHMAEEAMHIAKEASKSKSEFLANMSHDIRTPMNAIVGLAQLMRHDIHDPEKMEIYLDKLQTTSQHLLGMLNNILDISKIESGSFTLRNDSVNLGQQLKQIATVIRPQAEQKRQELEITGANIRHEEFMGDATRIRQILLNLLSNAVKYTPEEGHILFHIEELAGSDEEHVIYQFTVRDDGIGMSEEFQRHIFEAYSRSEESQRREIQGTGLGMVITKNFVEMMGGTIQVESTLGHGSVFIVTIPFTASDAKTKEAPGVWINENRIEEPLGKSVLRGMSILCAEDNELNAEILKALLEMAGAQCYICGNGKQLVDTFENAKPDQYDVILTDIQMPVMNGYEAVRQIRGGSSREAQTIPIIAMTANVFAEDIQKCLDCGMNAHVGKPIEIEALEKAVQQVRRDI